MMVVDRAPFEQSLANLCAGFNIPCTPERTNAYWTGLAKMNIRGFVVAIEYALGPDGPERMPTVHVIWEIYRKLRGSGSEAASGKGQIPEYDILHTYSQRVLLSFLRHQDSGASRASLAEMISAKNLLVSQYRLICSEEPSASLELRDALWEKFKKLWVTRTEIEYQDDLQRLQRSRGLV